MLESLSATLRRLAPAGPIDRPLPGKRARHRSSLSRYSHLMSSSNVSPSLEYRVGDQPVPGYTLVAYLGGGAMGQVWKARTDKGFYHALKFVRLSGSGGRKEWRGLALVRRRGIRHGYLLPIHDFWLKDKDGNIITDVDEVPVGGGTSPGGEPAEGALAATRPVSAGSTDVHDVADAATPQGTLAGISSREPGELHSAITAVHEHTVGSSGSAGSPRTAAQALAATLTTAAVTKASQLIVAMELADGTLFDCLSKPPGVVPVESLLRYIEQAAEGLDYLHKEGIIHRDIKPHNIVLVGGVAKISDYGLLISTDPDLRGTSNGYSLPYASPEALAFQPGVPQSVPLTGKADQYSLAVTYHELRTGQLPYEKMTIASITLAAEKGNFDLSRIKNKAVRAVLLKALSKSPAARYNSCADFVKALAQAERAKPSIPWLKIAAGVLVVALAGAAASVAAQRWPALRSLVASLFPGGPGPQPIRPEPIPPEPQPVGSTDPHQAPPVVPPAHDPPPRDLPPNDLQRAVGKILASTKGSAERLLQTPALAADYANVVEGRDSWKLLEPADAQAIAKLVAAFEPQLVEFSEPLDEAWLDRLGHLLNDARATLLARLQRQAENRSWSRLEVVERDYHRFARLRATVGVDPHRLEIRQLKVKLLQQLLEEFLVDDQWLTDPGTSHSLDTLLASAEKMDAEEGVNLQRELPLVPLLRVEQDLAKLDAANQPYPAELSTRCERLLQPRGSPWHDYALFLVARCKSNLPGGKPFSATAPELELLLRWSPLTSAGTTPIRSRQAGSLLVRLAEDLLGVPAAADALALFELGREKHKLASDCLAKAIELGRNDPYAEGLFAVALSIPAAYGNTAADWARVASLAQAALEGWPQDGNLSREHRRKAVALAQSLSVAYLPARQTSAGNRAALETFAEILRDSFRDDDPPSSRDKLLYALVVTPALRLPSGVTDPAEREKLAMIWAVKGRLFERDRDLTLVATGTPAQIGDPYAATMLAANAAFATARQLNDRLEYAAGFGRTALKLPHDHFQSSRGKFQTQLAEIVSRFSREADGNPNLALLAAWVHWDRAKRAATLGDRIRGAGDALKLYSAVAEATGRRDPYAIGTLARTDASDVHVQLAYYRDLRSADEVDPLLTDEQIAAKPTAQLTKYEHLRLAVKLASEAELDVNNPLPENPLISKGNAYEDLGLYCKQIAEGYPQAAECFRRAAAQAGLRSKVYALLSLGRCQYRWSVEPADMEADTARRHARLGEAYDSLQAAIQAAGQEDAPDEAEARMWMAKVLLEATLHGPADIVNPQRQRGPFFDQALGLLLKREDAREELAMRASRLQEARESARRAAELASASSREEHAAYVLQYVEVTYQMAEALRVRPTFIAGLQRSSLLDDVGVQCEEVLRQAGQNPRIIQSGYAWRALQYLVNIRESIDLPQGRREQALAEIRAHERLFDAAEYPDQRVELLLLEESLILGTTPSDVELRESLLRRAEQFAEKIPSEPARDRARSQCKLRRATRLSAEILDSVKQNQVRRIPVTKFSDFWSAYRGAEADLARSMGPDVVQALAGLNQQTLRSVAQGHFDSQLGSLLRVQRLRDLVEEMTFLRFAAESVLLAWDEQLGGVLRGELTPEKRKVAEYLRGCLLADAFRRHPLEPLSRSRQTMLGDLEQRLAAAPAPPAPAPPARPAPAARR